MAMLALVEPKKPEIKKEDITFTQIFKESGTTIWETNISLENNHICL